MSYSHRDFTGRSLKDADLNGMTITGSCFSQEKPDTQVFPDDMTGVTFINCNLDNCLIPSGTFVEGCSQRRFKAMEDGKDWLVDSENNPVSLLNGAE